MLKMSCWLSKSISSHFGAIHY